jgi:hypothetical protein
MRLTSGKLEILETRNLTAQHGSVNQEVELTRTLTVRVDHLDAPAVRCGSEDRVDHDLGAGEAAGDAVVASP